ncbi:glycosyltransferase family 2 protein [Halomonas sp. ISL-60]|uniref:glycosyltransferase family A protein n=1 Tax=Halomonas sp. ISL-56 TaxID=2819149 RepID=UPI001BEC3D53|nr:glycosyltransferase family A protein [Halomonas sp. ISL-56]MBT2772711.1 glycosyltransferase family 2 protein [Halomonas sp. ISL-60]MBT2804050.1 glycosyltransferase family 2 protein [Halomonas sp. ISL-56]
MCKFSVIVPVHNKASTLLDSLTCLYNQTFKNFEIIVVDDASTDGSLQILIQEERKGKLRLFQRDEPGPGGYAARNYGAQQATSQWLVFFDADDLLVYDHLSIFANAISENPSINFFVNAFRKMEGNIVVPRSESLQNGVLSRQAALAAFSRSDFIHMNGACIRKSTFMALGGFPVGRYRRAGDVYFWLKVICSLKMVHYDPTVTSMWLLHNSGVVSDKSNMTQTHPCLDLKSELKVGLSWIEKHYLNASINRKILSWAVEKKIAGRSVETDIRSLILFGMRPRQWMTLATLIIPQPYYGRLRERVLSE